MSDAADDAAEAYDDDTEDEPTEEPIDEGEDDEPGELVELGEEPLPSPPPAASRGKIELHLLVDVDERASEESMPSAAFDTPVTRQIRTLVAELEGVLTAGTKGRAEATKAAQESWPAVVGTATSEHPREQVFAEIKAAAPPGSDEVDVLLKTDGPLGIVFRSTVPTLEGRAFVKALRDGSAASEQPQLTAALTGAAAVGQQLVLTAVNGAPIEDLEGMGPFRAGLEAVKKAQRPVTLRLLLAPPPVVQPLQPEPESEPEQAAVQAEADDDDDGERSPGGTRRPQIGDRGAAATRKTRNALLGGLRSGTLEGAVSKMEDGRMQTQSAPQLDSRGCF